MRKQGAILMLDLQALRHVKGECEKSVKRKEKSVRMDNGKVARLATSS